MTSQQRKYVHGLTPPQREKYYESRSQGVDHNLAMMAARENRVYSKAEASPVKLKKKQAGAYVSEDGKYAVLADGYERIAARDREGHGMAAGITGREWAVVYDAQGRLNEDLKAGDNLHWYPTKAAALEALQQHRRNR